MELKKKVVSGFLWTAGEKFSSLFIHLCISVILLRLLTPAEYGLFAMLMVFSNLANSIVDSGFSQALIQKQNVGRSDFNSIFWLNLGIALVMYAGLVALATPISRFYNVPELTRLVPWVFLIIPLSSLGLIQTTVLTKKMDFRTISKANLAATIASGAVVLGAALAGFGVWALVAQSLSLYAVRTLMLWIYSAWRPVAEFSGASVKGLWGLGSRLFATGMVTQLFNNLTGMIIGKLYKPDALGFYDRAMKLKEGFASAINLSVQNVTFPAFASLQDDSGKLKTANRKAISMQSFVLFPAMLGLAAIADEGFMIVGQDKWMPAVPYFKVLCFAALFMPLANISLNILKATGKGNTILGIEILKKSFGLAAIFYAATVGIYAIVWAYFAWSAFEMAVNVFFARKITRYRVRELIFDTLPYLAMSAVMYLCIVGTGHLFADRSIYAVLALKLFAGAVSFLLMGWLSKPEAWTESLQIAKATLDKFRKKQ